MTSSRLLGVCVLAAACARSPSFGSVERRVAPLLWGGGQKLLAEDAAELDQFGCSVSAAGDTALVGAYGESSSRGAAYLFVARDDAWRGGQKLAAHDGVDLDRFGASVSLDADRILVGAFGAASSRGAAYVFVRTGGSVGDAWTEEQKLAANDGAGGDNFGYAVSLAGDRALVGAHSSRAARGAAYVFVRTGDGWTEEQKLVAGDADADDHFGWSVSLAGDRALVGAPGDDGGRGAAYVFVRAGNVWTEERKLVPADAAALDNFGNAVSLARDRALVGAYWKDDFRGAAYVFASTGGAWTEEQKLLPSDAGNGRFGNAVSLAGDRALVGAFAHGDGRGAAYAFSRSSTNGEPVWTEAQRLAPSDTQADLFAWSVSLAGDRALVGAIYNDQLRGAAYAYSLGFEDRDAGSADSLGHDGPPPEAGPAGSGACIRGDVCPSGHCEDGICCDRTCSPSERCRAALKVSGEDGVCGPAAAAAPGAPCRFDVLCTSGRCQNGTCADTDGLPDGACPPGGACIAGDGGCGCGTGSSPPPGRRDPFALVLLLVVLRRRRRRSVRQPLARGRRGAIPWPRRGIAIVLICAGLALSGCGGGPHFGAVARDGAADVGGGTGSPMLPARVRRLSNAEYAASVYALLGVDAEAQVAGFPRDATQMLGFSVNDAQIVSAVLASKLDSSAQGIVTSARQSGELEALAPCEDPGGAGEACARAFIESFGAQAYRRPLVAEDIDPLLGLYRAVAGEGGSYEEGIDFVTRAILQAPGFLYLTELGDSTAATAAGTTTLTPNEIASLLSYVVTAGPPDRTLLANVGVLVTADGREQQLRRLLPTLGARKRLVRVVREWLGIDGVAEIDKDSNVYPTFSSHHNAIAAESQSFIDEVLSNGPGSLQALLGAEWTAVSTAHGASDDEIGAYYAGYYGLDVDAAAGGDRVGLTGAAGGTRVGILNQGAFLARFATATGSNPVMRGVAVMRRVACLELADPVELDIDVVPPVPDAETPKTTRELFAAHAADPVCRPCHQKIDNFGFLFEQYDGIGGYRAADTKAAVTGTGTDLDGAYADSNDLARALSASATARACMARQLFRASTGRGDGSVRSAEDAFMAEWRKLPADRQGNLVDTLVALARSNVFVERSTAR